MAADFALRAMAEADRQQAAAVWWRSSVAASPRADHPTAEALADRLLDEPWQVVLAVRERSILGLLAVQPQDGWLRQLFIDPAAQGTGVGGALLAEAKRLMTDGFWLNTDVANARARRFYEARGLRLTGEAPHPRWGNLQARYQWTAEGGTA